MNMAPAALLPSRVVAAVKIPSASLHCWRQCPRADLLSCANDCRVVGTPHRARILLTNVSWRTTSIAVVHTRFCSVRSLRPPIHPSAQPTCKVIFTGVDTAKKADVVKGVIASVSVMPTKEFSSSPATIIHLSVPASARAQFAQCAVFGPPQYWRGVVLSQLSSSRLLLQLPLPLPSPRPSPPHYHNVHHHDALLLPRPPSLPLPPPPTSSCHRS